MTVFIILLLFVCLCFIIIGYNFLMSGINEMPVIIGIATLLGLIVVIAIIAETETRWMMVPNDQYRVMERACVSAGVGTYTTEIVHRKFKILPSAEKESTTPP